MTPLDPARNENPRPLHSKWRWVGVIPAWFLAWLLVWRFLAQLLLYVSPADSWLHAEIGLPPEDEPLPTNAEQVARTVAPFFAVFAGAYVAPRRRRLMAVLFAVVPVLILLGMTTLAVVGAAKDPDRAFADYVRSIDMTHVEALGGSVLSLIASFIVWRTARSRSPEAADTLTEVHDQ